MEVTVNQPKQVTRSIVIDENLYDRLSYLDLIHNQVITHNILYNHGVYG